MNTERLKNQFLYISLSVLVYICATYYLYSKGFLLSDSNRYIIIVIFALFFISLFRLLELNIWLYKENRALLAIEREALNSKKSVDDLVAILPNSLIKKRVNQVKKITLANGHLDHKDLAALLEGSLRSLGNIVKYLAGVTLLIGLLGTFLGMTDSIKGFNKALDKKPNLQQLSNIDSTDKKNEFNKGNIISIVGGIDKALGTSISGILTFIILNFLYILYKNAQSFVTNRLEEVFLIRILPFYQQSDNNIIVKCISEALYDVLPATISKSTNELSLSTANLKEMTHELKEGQESLKEYIELLKSDTESRNKLSNETGESMKLFAKNAEELKSSIVVLNQHLKAQSDASLEFNSSSKLMFSNLQSTYLELKNVISSQMPKIVTSLFQINESNKNIMEVSSKLSEKIDNKEILEEFQRLTKENRESTKVLADTYKSLEKSYINLTEYTKSENDKYIDVLEKIDDTHNKLPEILNNLLVYFKNDQNFSQMNILTDINRRIFKQLNDLYSNLESSHEKLSSYVTLRDSAFETMLETNNEVKSKVLEVLNEHVKSLRESRNELGIVSAKLETLKNVLLKALSKFKPERRMFGLFGGKRKGEK